EKLQKAIEVTIAAGYQLDSEAFEFLSQNAETADPVGIMNLALQRIQELQEKPMFIDKVFLETIMERLMTPIPAKPLQQQQEALEHQTEPQQNSSVENV